VWLGTRQQNAPVALDREHCNRLQIDQLAAAGLRVLTPWPCQALPWQASALNIDQLATACS